MPCKNNDKSSNDMAGVATRWGTSPRLRIYAAALALATVAVVSSAQELPDATTGLETQPVKYVVPAGTIVEMRFVSEVGSKTHERGNRFPLEVSAPVMVDDQVVIPAGTYAEGEVIHAQKASIGGKAGELILTARFLRIGQQEVPLRSFTAGSGSSQVNLSAGVSSVIGLPGFFITGKNIVVASGTAVSARVAQDAHLTTIDVNNHRESNDDSSQ